MKIVIFTTGGTIDKVYFDAKSEFEVGEPQIGHILREAMVGFEFEVRSLMQKDSLEMTDADRKLIRAAVEHCMEPLVLITHGIHSTEVGLARIVIPRSFSRSFESIARSSTRWLSRKVPDWRKSWSTRVVLPWSTCAMIATLRSAGWLICISQVSCWRRSRFGAALGSRRH